MKIAVLGTGMVGVTLGSKLVELGHEVMMGSRTQDNESARAWTGSAGEGAQHSTFGIAANFADEIVINAIAGAASLDALGEVGDEELAGKLLIDTANPLEPNTSPPELAFANTTSLGEQIQVRFPEARVVKALNTVNAKVMVDPGMLAEPTSLFVCGNDRAAKETTIDLIESFGWEREMIIDLGSIDASRGAEMYMALWVRGMSVLGNPFFNVRVVRER